MSETPVRRVGAAARGRALDHRPGPLRRRRRAAGNVARGGASQPARPRADRARRRRRGAPAGPASSTSSCRPTWPHSPGMPLLSPPQPDRAGLPGILPQEIVSYAGQPVALVVAESAAEAADAVDALRVEYEPLPVVASLDDALRPDGPRVHPGGNVVSRFTQRVGDPPAPWPAPRWCCASASACTAAPAWPWRRAPSPRAGRRSRSDHRVVDHAGTADPSPDARALPRAARARGARRHPGHRRRASAPRPSSTPRTFWCRCSPAPWVARCASSRRAASTSWPSPRSATSGTTSSWA